MKRRILLCALAAFFGLFLVGDALADWKDEQAALFEQIPVKPGDKIDSSNWEKVKDILPPSVVNWVKKGDFVLNIGEFKWDYNTDAAWREATAANAGKYDIGAGGEIIVKATGELPKYMEGEPFPDIDWQNDPNAGVKIAHRAVIKGARTGTLTTDWITEWVGRQGRERYIDGVWKLTYFWGRPDGPIDNPSGLFKGELNKVTSPYDVAGIVQLTLTTIENTPDQAYGYVPAIRRVKKFSGTTRSSPFLGTDFVNDDAYGFYGKIESMNWKVLDKKIVLLPVASWAVEGPAKFVKQADGGWAIPSNLGSPKNGYLVDGWKGAPWAPVDMVYIPRMMYVVEVTPKDPYYNYGKALLYIDPVAGFTYKVVNDKAGAYWKTLVVSYAPAAWEDKVTVCSGTWYISVDDKTDHASICNCFGKHDNFFVNVVYKDPTITPALFSPTAMPALSK